MPDYTQYRSAGAQTYPLAATLAMMVIVYPEQPRSFAP